MGKIIQITDINNGKIQKGEEMYKGFLKEIRKKPKGVGDMPERAKDVLKYFQIDDFSAGVPIVEILARLGFKVYQSDLEPDGLSAYIAVDSNYKSVFGANKITCVNIKNSIGHKKFALAHELGHYLFDFDDEKDTHYYNTYFPQKDAEKLEEERANKFASNLLMPEKEFQKKLKELKKAKKNKVDIINELGEYFYVSPTAILKRFAELGISGYEDTEI